MSYIKKGCFIVLSILLIRVSLLQTTNKLNNTLILLFIPKYYKTNFKYTHGKNIQQLVFDLSNFYTTYKRKILVFPSVYKLFVGKCAEVANLHTHIHNYLLITRHSVNTPVRASQQQSSEG